MAKNTKLRQKLMKVVDREKQYTVTDAVKTLKECDSAKFDETVDVALNLGIDPRHADQQVRGTVVLPHGTGKTVRVVVFAKGEAADEAKKAGADEVGTDDLAKKIQGGWLEFDRVIAAPDCMPVVGKLGQVLGPKGMMPNPKLGTVTPNVAKAVKDIKSGMIEFRAEKKGIVHAGVGKKSFDEKKLEENVQAFLDAIKAAKPSGSKGVYMKKATLSSTMGPGIHLDTSAI